MYGLTGLPRTNPLSASVGHLDPAIVDAPEEVHADAPVVGGQCAGFCFNGLLLGRLRSKFGSLVCRDSSASLPASQSRNHRGSG